MMANGKYSFASWLCGKVVKCRASVIPYFLTDMLCISLNLAISLTLSCGIAAVIPLSGNS
jgi:hypothetical protein